MSIATARRIGLYLLAVGVLYCVISFPERSGEFTQLLAESMSHAVDGLLAPLP
ncbi:hypothetical protein RM844_12985 [Streptomyces sp. DSM 44915]|uniref:VanZ family protein n=1 Tax=Streptomyces chisholmiae TaxID=3075540 RepID=A0ABU2JQL1_9ACTN|nr:hypothetical protein [Streptomyces sp. DSM 44915]MDT0267202.1 hypothetical protein [Streptomyces sp. DSM 44915]